MSDSWPNSDSNQLFDTVLKLKTVEECEKFFRDLCTLNELKTMSERWEVARLVNDEIPYREINKKTGVSTATITRVAHWLHHGMGGYQLMLKR
jgi:TrpR-related protein YerC/YecD